MPGAPNHALTDTNLRNTDLASCTSSVRTKNLSLIFYSTDVTLVQ